MLDVKDAVKVAGDYLKALYAEEQIKDVRLEEVEVSEERDYWLITLSFLEDRKPDSPFAAILPNVRSYKMFKICSRTGEVLAMKIRQLDSALSQ